MAEVVVSPTCNTAWDALEKAGMFPVEIVCDGYKPLHPFNPGCHSRLPIRVRAKNGAKVDTGEYVLAHIEKHNNPQLGAGFIIRFKRTEGRVWGGWNALQRACVEAVDVRCDHCEKQVPLRPVDIISHTKAHMGKNKKSVVTNTFCFTLVPNHPLIEDTEDDI